MVYTQDQQGDLLVSCWFMHRNNSRVCLFLFLTQDQESFFCSLLLSYRTNRRVTCFLLVYVQDQQGDLLVSCWFMHRNNSRVCLFLVLIQDQYESCMFPLTFYTGPIGELLVSYFSYTGTIGEFPYFQFSTRPIRELFVSSQFQHMTNRRVACFLFVCAQDQQENCFILLWTCTFCTERILHTSSARARHRPNHKKLPLNVASKYPSSCWIYDTVTK